MIAAFYLERAFYTAVLVNCHVYNFGAVNSTRNLLLSGVKALVYFLHIISSKTADWVSRSMQELLTETRVMGVSLPKYKYYLFSLYILANCWYIQNNLNTE